MIKVPCPTCGQDTLQPDPPESIKSQEEKVAFRKEWDQQVLAGQDRLTR